VRVDDGDDARVIAVDDSVELYGFIHCALAFEDSTVIVTGEDIFGRERGERRSETVYEHPVGSDRNA